jgi:hypothetical protein
MATVIEDRTMFCCAFFSGSAKDIHKEIFPVYFGKCLSRKAIPPWWQKFH